MTRTDVIKVHKEKQFLIFDLSDGKQVKYDFAKRKPLEKAVNMFKVLISNYQVIRFTILKDCVMMKSMSTI